jgi:lipid-binding SYLF domain-containing protein
MEDVMNKVIKVTAIALALLVPVTLVAGDDAKTESKKQTKQDKTRAKLDLQARQALEKLFSSNESAKDLYDRAYGYAAFNTTKAGFFVTGSGGKGVAVQKDSGDKAYMKIGSGGAGLSFGVQSSEIVFLLQDEETFNNFVNKGWTANADATAAAGDAGANAKTAFVNGIATYVMTKGGLMVSADLTGTKVWIDPDLND